MLIKLIGTPTEAQSLKGGMYEELIREKKTER